MSTQIASLFRYQDYISAVSPLVAQVDQGNFTELQARANAAIREIRAVRPRMYMGYFRYESNPTIPVEKQDWSLLEHDEPGPTADQLLPILAQPSQYQIGYWFLVLLEKYLSPCQFPGANWSVIDTALGMIGWNERDRNLLFSGYPTYKLLKPTLAVTGEQGLNDNSPYWFWLRTRNAAAGWLPLPEIQRLSTALSQTQTEISNLDLTQYPRINIDNPVVIRQYKEHLHDGYKATLSMLQSALDTRQGLFMSMLRYT